MQEAEELVEEVQAPPPDPVTYRWISTTRSPWLQNGEEGEAMQGVEATGAVGTEQQQQQEKKMSIMFSVPNCVLYPHGRPKQEGEGEEAAVDEDAPAATVSSPTRSAAGTAAPRFPPAEKPRCAVPNCGKDRKYRLVKDWQIGACGMDHLKVLEAR